MSVTADLIDFVRDSGAISSVYNGNGIAFTWDAGRSRCLIGLAVRVSETRPPLLDLQLVRLKLLPPLLPAKRCFWPIVGKQGRCRFQIASGDDGLWMPLKPTIVRAAR